MKVLICSLCLMLLFCGCGKKEATPSGGNGTSSQYIDANVDFTGKKTIVGRWKCATETQNGETKDVSAQEIYYIFSSDKTIDSFYLGENMNVYSKYSLKGNEVTLYLGESSVTLKYELSENRLTLTTLDGRISTVYDRVAYEK